MHTPACIVGPALPGSLLQSPGLGPGDCRGKHWQPAGPSATWGESPSGTPWGEPWAAWAPWSGLVKIGQREGNRDTQTSGGCVPRTSAVGGGRQESGGRMGLQGMAPADTPAKAGEHQQGSHPVAGPSRVLAHSMLSPPLAEQQEGKVLLSVGQWAWHWFCAPHPSSGTPRQNARVGGTENKGRPLWASRGYPETLERALPLSPSSLVSPPVAAASRRCNRQCPKALTGAGTGGGWHGWAGCAGGSDSALSLHGRKNAN